MTTSPVEMWEAEVNDLKRALGLANGERERLQREIVEAHRLVGSDGSHAALVEAITRLKRVVKAAKAVAESRCEHNRAGLDCDVCRTARFIAKHVLDAAEKE